MNFYKHFQKQIQVLINMEVFKTIPLDNIGERCAGCVQNFWKEIKKKNKRKFYKDSFYCLVFRKGQKEKCKEQV